MRIGIGICGVAPSDFWKLTFKEFAAIYNGKFPPGLKPDVMTLEDLQELKDRFPDGVD